MGRIRRAALAGLACLSGLLASAPATADDALAVAVADHGRGAYRVTGTFSVAAPREVVWRVLTDYDGLGRFIPSMRSALVRREGAGVAIVAQATTTRVMGVSATTRVRLRLQETPPGRIAFADVSGRDFTRYEGAWGLTAEQGGTRVDYAAIAEPRFVPPLVGQAIMQGTVRDLLRDLRREVLRRAAP
jgi:carbon monoxide dehydrogenase subunit G